MVVGYNDRSVKIFDLKDESTIAHYKPTTDSNECTTDIDVLYDNTNFVTGFTDGTVLVGSSWSSKVRSNFRPMKHTYLVRFWPEFEWLIFVFQTLLEVDTKSKVESVKFVTSDAAALIAVGSSNGVEIWDYSKKVGCYSFRFV